MEFFIFLFVIIFFLYFLAILFFNTDIAVDVKRLKLLFDDNYSKKIQIIEKEIDVSFSVFNKINAEQRELFGDIVISKRKRENNE